MTASPNIPGTLGALLRKNNNPSATERKETMPQYSLLTRFASLVRGSIGTSLRHAEAHNSEAVYDDAILQRTRHYNRLREAVARLTLLRTRLESDLQQQRADLHLVERALDKVVLANDDPRALVLIRKKRTVSADIAQGEEKLQKLTAQADHAKADLQEIADSIQQLKSERSKMLARKVHAEARLQVSEVLRQSGRISPDVDIALEHAREAILQREHEAVVETTLDHASTEALSFSTLRRKGQTAEDIQMLAALKQEIGIRQESTRKD
jgi:phage shock protein A